MTNDIHFSYLRNYWKWQDQAGPPQIPGLGGVMEIGGECHNALIPYNVDSQDTRQRFWGGHDYFLIDQLTHLHGNHLFQFGGTYQRNDDIHGRNDNGVGIDTSTTYRGCERGRHCKFRLYASGGRSFERTLTVPGAVRSGDRNYHSDAVDVHAQRAGPELESSGPVRFRPQHYSQLRPVMPPTPGT